MNNTHYVVVDIPYIDHGTYASISIGKTQVRTGNCDRTLHSLVNPFGGALGGREVF